MKKYLLAFFVFFFILPESISAETKTAFSITGGKKKGDMMTASVTVSGTSCILKPPQATITEIVFSGSGAGYPFAADLSNAEISATLNGTPIPGHKRYVTHPPSINDLVWHVDPAFTYDPAKDTVRVSVTKMRRGNVGGMMLNVYLMQHDLGNSPAYDGCFSGFKAYNTVTPLSDTPLLGGATAYSYPTPSVSPKPQKVLGEKVLPTPLPVHPREVLRPVEGIVPLVNTLYSILRVIYSQ